MAGWWYLILSLLGALLVLNAAKPSRGTISLMPSWLLAFLTTDLAPAHIGLAAIVTAGFAWGGALGTVPGKVALVVFAISSLALLVLWLPNLQAARSTESVANDFEFDDVDPIPRKLLFLPFTRVRNDVEVKRNIEFFKVAGRSLKLDLYQGMRMSDKRPGLVYLHGGGWIVGDKREQGLPLCNHLATLGWACVNANYRLSPSATYPDHVIDAKAAVAWLRENADEYGVDPNFIAIAGGSAGAHIAAMTALTPGNKAMQPGFEDKDTSVQAAITFYGVYDMTNRLGLHNEAFLDKFIGPMVIKAFPGEEPEKFVAASPRDHVARATMPWLILQGDADTLTPAIEAREFANALRKSSNHVVAYAEIPSAQHAFDIYYSPRAIAAVELASRFLVTVYRQSLAERREAA